MTENAVTKIEPEDQKPANVLEIIDRMSRMPNVSTAKLAEMMELQERLEARESKKAFEAAMSLAQRAMHGIVLDANNPQTQSKYASYKELDRVIRPIYTELGFALSFGTADGAPAEHVRVTCDVSCAGHTKSYHLDVPADGKGAKGGNVMTKTHATMSALSYGRRGLCMLIFNLVPGGTWDDDGNAAGGGKATGEDPHRQLSEDELQQLMHRATEVGAGAAIVLRFINRIRPEGADQARALGDIMVGELDRLYQGLTEYAKQRGQK